MKGGDSGHSCIEYIDQKKSSGGGGKMYGDKNKKRVVKDDDKGGIGLHSVQILFVQRMNLPRKIWPAQRPCELIF